MLELALEGKGLCLGGNLKEKKNITVPKEERFLDCPNHHFPD